MHLRNIKGGLILLAIFLLISLLKGQSSETPVASHGGRFQIVINPNVRADTFLLDTDTGRTWRTVEYGNLEGNPMLWQLQDRIDSQQEFWNWAAQQKQKEGKK